VGGLLAAKSWVEKLGDESDRWLNAVRLEEEGDFAAACELYLREGKIQEEKKDFAKAGLCYVSAAKCKFLLGDREQALELYRVAGDAYFKYAESVTAISLNSAVWGYRTSSKCYFNARLYPEAQKALASSNLVEEKIRGFAEEVIGPVEESMKEGSASRLVGVTPKHNLNPIEDPRPAPTESLFDATALIARYQELKRTGVLADDDILWLLMRQFKIDFDTVRKYLGSAAEQIVKTTRPEDETQEMEKLSVRKIFQETMFKAWKIGAKQ